MKPIGHQSPRLLDFGQNRPGFGLGNLISLKTDFPDPAQSYGGICRPKLPIERRRAAYAAAGGTAESRHWPEASDGMRRGVGILHESAVFLLVGLIPDRFGPQRGIPPTSDRFGPRHPAAEAATSRIAP